jgi:hypothetical protein
MTKLLQTTEKVYESKYAAWIFAGLFFVVGVVLAFVANGTAGEGDSVMHYQFAQGAFKHHELFFDHWAKPLYVLIASPFAQLGFSAMKGFNLSVTVGAMLFTYLVAKQLQIKRAALVVFFLAFSPALITHSLSGFTEPLFALVLIMAVYFYLRSFIVASIILVSFLPFVRSEGLIICGVFGVLLLFERRWLLIPLLGFGHLFYAIAGYKTYGTLLWVFKKIPYARLSSVYGKGTWDHFIVKLPSIIGIPLCVLLAAGILYGAYLLFKSISGKEHLREVLLVYGVFAAYFVAHTCFWALGIFNSYGLMRVLIGVLPLMAIIELRGINILGKRAVGSVVALFIVVYVATFPFTSNPYSWHYKADFCLKTEQELQQEMSQYVKHNYPDYKNYRYYFDANYVAEALGVDYFDTVSRKNIWQSWECPPNDKCLLIWDDWYSGVQWETLEATVREDYRFVLVKEFTREEPWGQVRKTLLFQGKNL